MPWNRESLMDQRVKLIGDWLSDAYSKSELARHYGISRPTLDKWLARYNALGADGLKELSRRPQTNPHRVSDEVLGLLIACKGEHPSWGPEKLVHILKHTHPHLSWPAVSTAGEWLKRAGLVQKRRFLNRPPAGRNPLREATAPNQTWAADFKGDFALQNGQRCFPLTITDHVSRFLLVCKAQASTAGARAGFDQAFREYGLPDVIRTDNGSPFASNGVSRISSLAAWLIRLGIYPERIQPGRPDQNGRHERMHRTLKAALLQAPEHNLVQQQLAFERFRQEFNYVRPHKALDMKVPGELYVPSTRQYDGRLPEVNYASDMEVRKVRQNGSMKWKGGMIFVSESLVGEALGLREVEDDVWDIYLCDYLLGRLKSGESRLTSLQKRKGCPRSQM